MSFEFCNGVNVLVGPNGSGKSNVVDALRWVFGEQNPRLLRGQRWQEVIFAGTAARRPLALAEVTVVLDNHDGHLGLPHSEIEVSRRLLRSGETEYFINRQPCRLKDVLDLVSGTGAAGSYAYIAQSAVDEVLNARPEDRRAALEDAAGLARYRQRREEADRRLGEIEQASQRLADIVAELQRQLEPLNREAELADRFLALRREREDIEALIWADAAFRQQRRHADALRRRDELSARIAEGRRILAAIEQEAALAQSNLASARGLRSAAEASARGLLAEENRRRAAAGVLQERLTNLVAEDGALKERLERLERRLGEVRRELTGSEEVEEAANGRTGDAGSGAAGARDRAAAGAARSLADAQARLAAAVAHQAEQAAIRNRCAQASERSSREAATLNEALRACLGRLKAADQRLAALDDQLARAGAELGGARAAGVRAQSELDRIAESLRVLRGRREASQLELAEVRAAEAAERESHGALRAEMMVAAERLAALDREPAPPAAAAAQAAHLARTAHGLDPLLFADMLRVQSGYERAAEAALGVALYALVVPDWEAAVAVVESRSRAASEAAHPGTAVFLPACARPALRGAVPVALDPLAAHVEADEQASALVAALLAGIAVTDDLPAAVDAVRHHPLLFSAVTRDGRAVLQGGLVLDGPPLHHAGPVALRRQREALSAETGRLSGRCLEAAARVQSLAARAQSLAGDAREAGAAVAATEAQMQRETVKAGRIAESIAAWAARCQALGEERERVTREREELADAAEDLRDRVLRAEEQAARSAAELTAAVEGAARAEAAVRARQSEYGQRRVQLARAEEAAKASRERRRSLFGEVENTEKELAAAALRRAQLAAQLNETSQALGVEQEALTTCTRARASQDREALRLESELAAAEEAAGGLARQARELSAANAALEGRIHRLDLLIERLAGEGRSLAVERKSLPPRFGELQPAAHNDPDALRARAGELTARLTELGPVDVGASEQHRRLRDRQEFLSRQQAQLQESAAALRSSAGELEREMTRRFRDGFELTRGEFRRIFTDLFGGGEADLRLTDPDHPLGSGVDIVAQPPGKRMANLALLSGGERALTAVALLFAVTGSPVHGFSVLDEVDAYLDDPNCARFSRYLRALAARERQFLVITHNKGTMEAADVLYGLTMEEQGVSRVISVRLDQAAATGETA